ncbi:MAG: CopG family transcriptional regulator [Planctomycetota bacterium]
MAKKNDKTVSVYLDDENRAVLEAEADAQDRSRSYLINAIIRAHREATATRKTSVRRSPQPGGRLTRQTTRRTTDTGKTKTK